MLQKISSVFVVYRRKTLTGSPDPMHAIGTDKSLQGVCVFQHALGKGGCLPQCMLGYNPPSPWTEFLTHTCLNITTVRTVIMHRNVYNAFNVKLNVI